MTAADALEALRAAVEPVVAANGASLYDVEISGAGRERVVRVLIDRDGGVDLDTVEQVTRALDGVVDDAVSGAFLLEVSSPGLERPLRRPEHFERALGALVSVKYRDAEGRSERVRGILMRFDAHRAVATFDDAGADVEIAIDAITSATTVFEWGAAAAPGGGKPGGRARAGKGRQR